jgi:hypothetical protein
MKTADDLFSDIVASRPAAHFDAVQALLRRFCEVAVEARRERSGKNIDRALELTNEMIELADLLHLRPLDDGKLRMQ